MDEFASGVLAKETAAAKERGLPLPTPFLDDDVVESERLHWLSRAVRSRVKGRVDWQSCVCLQCSSTLLNQICNSHQGTSAAECNNAAEASKLCKTGHRQEGSRCPARPWC